YDAAGFGSPWGVNGGDLRAGRKEPDVHAAEIELGEIPHLEGLVLAERYFLADRVLGGERHYIVGRDGRFCESVKDLAADSARGADDGNAVTHRLLSYDQFAARSQEGRRLLRGSGTARRAPFQGSAARSPAGAPSEPGRRHHGRSASRMCRPRRVERELPRQSQGSGDGSGLR